MYTDNFTTNGNPDAPPNLCVPARVAVYDGRLLSDGSSEGFVIVEKVQKAVACGALRPSGWRRCGVDLPFILPT